MLRFGKMLKASRSQSGFTIVEVSMAMLLLLMASIGMIGVFNSSTQLSLIARQAKEAQQFARTVSEKIRALPFYVPYSGVDADVDDYFWGTAGLGQQRESFTTNNWDTPPENPFVDCPTTLATDSRFTCQVKMAYVLDDLSTIGMKSDWIPEAGTTQEGKDEPRDNKDKAFNVIKYEVKVTWISRRIGGSTTRTYSYVTLMTSTESEAYIGVVSMINISTDPSQWGTGGEKSNTAPHTPSNGTASNVQVEIKGYGFNKDSVPLLVRSGYPDLAFQSFTVNDDSKTITGFLKLDSGSTGKPWSPRQAPGMWTVRVGTGAVFAYGYEIFEVEFPRPVITYRDPVKGPTLSSAFSITAGGNNVLNLGGTPPSYCGATIRLVKDDAPATIIDPIAGTNTYKTPVPANKGYYPDYNTVTAVFDLRNRQPGNYYVEIANCENNAGPLEGAGNTISIPAAGFKFEIYLGGIFYPDADPETSSVDGWVNRYPVIEAFANIRKWAGSWAGPAVNEATSPNLTGCGGLLAIPNTYNNMARSIFVFDTSAIPSGATITSATFGIYVTSRLNDLGMTDAQAALSLVGVTPTTDTNIVPADYNIARWTFTRYANDILWSNVSTGAYNTMALLPAGLAIIGKAPVGRTRLGLTLGVDTDNGSPPWVNGKSTQYGIRFADYTGTTYDPYLEVRWSL
jgi:hypothetical protein